jgi:hypothetical protein
LLQVATFDGRKQGASTEMNMGDLPGVPSAFLEAAAADDADGAQRLALPDAAARALALTHVPPEAAERAVRLLNARAKAWEDGCASNAYYGCAIALCLPTACGSWTPVVWHEAHRAADTARCLDELNRTGSVGGAHVLDFAAAHAVWGFAITGEPSSFEVALALGAACRDDVDEAAIAAAAAAAGADGANDVSAPAVAVTGTRAPPHAPLVRMLTSSSSSLSSFRITAS